VVNATLGKWICEVDVQDEELDESGFLSSHRLPLHLGGGNQAPNAAPFATAFSKNNTPPLAKLWWHDVG
jgi:hypothetical protein